MEVQLVPEMIYGKGRNIIAYHIHYSDDLEEKSLGRVELSFTDTGNMYIENLYILEEYRGNGVATATINWIIEFGKKFGIQFIWLMVPFISEQAQRIYRRAGFVFLNYISDYCYKMEYQYERTD
ncbi:MAG TPA: GNAT family N-acetyltransferase [Nitrososphaeraceae archaeon]|nr:GNAT family N-acetyltransferase [Nitrososphaeraceae archaeon]